MKKDERIFQFFQGAVAAFGSGMVASGITSSFWDYTAVYVGLFLLVLSIRAEIWHSTWEIKNPEADNEDERMDER